MASKTSFFNGTIYKKTLLRFFPWSLCYALILLLQLPFYFIVRYQSLFKYNYPSATGFINRLSSMSSVSSTNTTIFVFIASIVAACLIYGFMFKQSALNMLHALPVTKHGLLFTNFLAGMTLLALPLVLAEGITIVFLAAVGAGSVAVLQLQILLAEFLVTVTFFVIATFCCTLSGSGFAAPIIYGIVNILSIAVCALISLLKSLFFYGFGEGIEHIGTFSLFAPIVRLCSNLMLEDYMKHSSIPVYSVNWVFPVVYALVGIGIVLLSMWLYSLRKAEHAGNTLAFSKTAWFFQTLGAIAAGIFSVILFNVWNESMPSDYVIIIQFLIGAVIGFIIIYMIVRKKFNIFRDVWKQALVFACAAFAFLMVLHLDIFGVENYIPDMDKVESADLSSCREIITDPETLEACAALHQAIIEQKNELQKPPREEYQYNEWIRITYTLKNGKTVLRSYDIPINELTVGTDDAILMQYYDIINQPENVMAQLLCKDFSPEMVYGITYCGSKEDVEIEDSNAQKAISKALIADIEEGNVIYECISDVTPANPAYDANNHQYYSQTLNFQILRPKEEIGGDADGSYQTMSRYLEPWITLEPSMKHTIACLEELGIVTDGNPLKAENDTENAEVYTD